MGGGIRGTKTYGVLLAVFLLCKIYPRSRWAIVRKDLPTLRRNLLPSFEKLRPKSFVGPFNQSTWTAKCTNGSEIVLFPEGFERDTDLERWKGLEVNGFVLEECSELQEKSLHKAIERAGAWIIPATAWDPEPNQPPPLILCTFNPCENWPLSTFFEPWENDQLEAPYFYLPSTVADNPYAPDAYLENLKLMPPAEYKRFVQGDWRSAPDPDQLIQSQWIRSAQFDVMPLSGERRLGVDVARFGDDRSCLASIEGNSLMNITSHSGLDVAQLAELVCKEIANPFWLIPARNTNIDGIGIGAGVVDITRRMRGHWEVREFIAGARPIYREEHPRYTFNNLISQAWWEFREKISKGQISLPEDLAPHIKSQFTSIKYKFMTEKHIVVESKKDLKKRVGKSPDEAESIVMGYFDIPQIQSSKVFQPTASF